MTVCERTVCLVAVSERQTVLEMLVSYYSIPNYCRLLPQASQWACSFIQAIVHLETLFHLHLTKSSKGLQGPVSKCPPQKVKQLIMNNQWGKFRYLFL